MSEKLLEKLENYQKLCLVLLLPIYSKVIGNDQILDQKLKTSIYLNSKHAF